MKRIKYSDYNPSMGVLIYIEDPINYLDKIEEKSINIPFEKLLFHHKDYLNLNEPYYIICSKGVKSRKAVNILEFYGYDVTQVYIE